jgi:hypothetical protein
MQRRVVCCATMMATVALFWAAGVRALIVVDSFNVGDGSGGVLQSVRTNSVGDGSTVTNAAAAGPTDIIGGYHTLTARLTQGGSGDIADASVDLAGNNAFRVDSSLSNARAQGTVVWDANGAGLGLIDISQGGTLDQFLMQLGGGISNFRYTLTVTDNDSTAAAVHDFLTMGGGQVPFLFSEFSGIDFSQVDRISLQALALWNDSDVSIDWIRTDTTVPEPSALALLGLCAVVGGLRRSRRS